MFQSLLLAHLAGPGYARHPKLITGTYSDRVVVAPVTLPNAFKSRLGSCCRPLRYTAAACCRLQFGQFANSRPTTKEAPPSTSPADPIGHAQKDAHKTSTQQQALLMRASAEARSSRNAVQRTCSNTLTKRGSSSRSFQLCGRAIGRQSHGDSSDDGTLHVRNASSHTGAAVGPGPECATTPSPPSQAGLAAPLPPCTMGAHVEHEHSACDMTAGFGFSSSHRMGDIWLWRARGMQHPRKLLGFVRSNAMLHGLKHPILVIM